jgi:DNA-binding MarR family transcriptional regulator
LIWVRVKRLRDQYQRIHEARLLAGLSPAERDRLAALLRKLGLTLPPRA